MTSDVSNSCLSRSNTEICLESIEPIDFYLVELGRSFTPRNRVGWGDAGTCPFHDDCGIGYCEVNLDTGAFRCKRCEAHGPDIVDFRRYTEGLTRANAARSIREDWNLSP